MRRLTATTLLPLALLLAAGASRSATAQEPFRWRGEIAAGQTLEIKGVKGEIRAEPASGREVEVVAVKRPGRRGSPGAVRVEVVRHGEGVTICAVYPSARRDRPNECAQGAWSNVNVQDEDTQVDFTVRVPAGVRLAAHNVSGDVRAEGLRGPVRAYSVSGDVRISTASWGEASTVSGDVSAALGSTDGPRDLAFRTVSGNVTLELPAGADAEVKANTVSGRISSDFSLEESRGFMHNRARGTLGRGGRDLELQTVSGDIRLRRGR